MKPKSILFLLSISLISFSLSSQDVWSPEESMKIKSISQDKADVWVETVVYKE